MKAICPLSFKQVNERAVQINAALALLSIIIFFFTPYKWIIFLLSIDFLIRGFFNPSYSFYGAISKSILRILNINPVMVNAGPKIFAAKIGFIFCCVIFVFYFLEFRAISLFVGSFFVFFAGLEAIFSVCIACKIYPLIHKMKTTKLL